MTEKATVPALRRDTATLGRRVLVADDEEKLARAVGRALSSAGFEVVVVPNGARAMEEVTRSAFSVVLTDIDMPGCTGIDLLRMVRAYDLDVPVVLMTGNPKLDDAVAAIQLGALQYLCKPFTLQTVVSTVERAAKLHRLASIKRQALEISGRSESEAGDATSLSIALDRALESMWMAYQPIVSWGGRKVMAYEALMRTSEASLPHPGAVLEAAERLGRLNELGRRVRGLVADSVSRVPGNAMLFVNLHTQDMLDSELASDRAPLSRFAERVVLEITERAAIENVKDIEARVEILRYMGYRIAIDDLGAGYAGLTSFATLEPEFVKLDMSLIRGIHSSEVRQKVVSSVVSLCGEMSKGVIAEGVEVGKERDQVSDLGCDWMQGYLFAKPSPPFPAPAWD